MTGNLPTRSQATDPAVLADLANKINVCLGKADDYRVTAAQHLAEAKKACKRAGINFKDWCSREIKFSLNEAYLLARIGESDDPPKALADHREKTRAKVNAHRSRVGLRNHSAPARKIPPEEAALAAIDKLMPDTKRNLIRSLATDMLSEDQRAMIVAKVETVEDARSTFKAALAKVDHDTKIKAVVGVMGSVGVNLIDLRDSASVAGVDDPAANVRSIVQSAVTDLAIDAARNLFRQLRGVIDEIDESLDEPEAEAGR